MSESLNSIRSRIESLGMDFRFVKTVKTGANGAERETWLLEYEGSRFIFVPGRKMSLWDGIRINVPWATAY